MCVCVYVCVLERLRLVADIIENAHLFRSMPRTNIREDYGKDTKGFASAHLDALKYSITTKERIELIQGVLLSLNFFISCLLVNTGNLSSARAVGVIQAFITSSGDIIDISSIMLKMKFQSEGLRMICRILNFPTDAHQMAEESQYKSETLKRHFKIDKVERFEHVVDTAQELEKESSVHVSSIPKSFASNPSLVNKLVKAPMTDAWAKEILLIILLTCKFPPPVQFCCCCCCSYLDFVIEVLLN